MNKISCFLVLFVISFSVLSQTDTTYLAPQISINFESNTHFHDLDRQKSNFRYVGYGLHLEKQVGRFSIGLGLNKQSLSKHNFYEPTGETRPATENQAERFGYNLRVNKINFINIPIRLYYLFPKNNLYIYTGLFTSFQLIREQTEGNRILVLGSKPDEVTYSIEDIEPFSLGMEMGFGMTMDISTTFKLFGRVSYIKYGFTDNSDIEFKQFGESFGVFSLGLRYTVYKNQ